MAEVLLCQYRLGPKENASFHFLPVGTLSLGSQNSLCKKSDYPEMAMLQQPHGWALMAGPSGASTAGQHYQDAKFVTLQTSPIRQLTTTK